MRQPIDWWSNIKISREFKKYLEALFAMLEALQNMWDGHLGTINIATLRIELAKPYIRPLQSASFRAVPEVRESEEKEIDQKLNKM